MLRRLEWIKNSGHFEDFHGDASLPELARINVIYGPNGSGKTSLASALDNATALPDGFQNLSVLVEESGARRSTGGGRDSVFSRLHVFSDGYVARSHRFHEGSPNIDAVLTLGQRTAEAEDRIAALREELGVQKAELDNAARQVKAAESAEKQTRERVSTAVVSDLSRVDGYRSRGSYNAGKVAQKYAGDRSSWKTLALEDLVSKKGFVASDNREPLEAGSFALAPPRNIQARAEELLSKTPVTIVLDTLRDHPEASEWIQSGQPLHDHSDVCLFCGQHLPDGRLHDIEQHFSDEVDQLQTNLGLLANDLDALQREAEALVHRIPHAGLIFEDLRPQYEQAANAVTEQSALITAWSKALRERIRAKHANVLLPVDCLVAEAPIVDASALEDLRNTHNGRVAEHAKLVATVAQEIESHHLKSEEAAFDRATKDMKVAQAKHKETQSRIEVISDEIAALEQVEGDPTPTAAVLTREVAHLLGRNELSFQARDGRYVVTRDGQPAVGLSVGERSAITLVHFLEEVARCDSSKGPPIAVIDDPVSSLDSNVFMGISTYIWNEAIAKNHIEQLILLTHNFELFRQWDVQIESLHRGKGLQKSHPAQLYELRSRHIARNGNPRRQPALVSWPGTDAVRKKLRSSYHHAFIATARERVKLIEDDSLEHRLDAQLLFPNVVRKILESFLAFKRPEWAGDFTDSMRRAEDLLVESGYTGDAGALRQRLTRYAHVYSHSQTPETDESPRPDEIASTIGSVFVFMNQIDPAHFQGLCSVVGIDHSLLLPEPVASQPEPVEKEV